MKSEVRGIQGTGEIRLGLGKIHFSLPSLLASRFESVSWESGLNRFTAWQSAEGTWGGFTSGKVAPARLSGQPRAFCDWWLPLGTPEGLLRSASAFAGLGSVFLSSGASGNGLVTIPSLASQWVEVGQGHWVRANG